MKSRGSLDGQEPKAIQLLTSKNMLFKQVETSWDSQIESNLRRKSHLRWKSGSGREVSKLLSAFVGITLAHLVPPH